MVPSERILFASGDFRRLWRPNAPEAQHGDFQSKVLKLPKRLDFKQLIQFQFFIVFLVSFGTIWKCLTLTGTIWAQFPITIQSSHNIKNLYRARTQVRN